MILILPTWTYDLVRWCLHRNQPGRYQLEAAIAAVHADAGTFADTAWNQILTLYNQLIAIAATPVVALNRAVAVGAVYGPTRGLNEINQLNLPSYYPFHAAWSEFLHQKGHIHDAVRAFGTAAPHRDDTVSCRYPLAQDVESLSRIRPLGVMLRGQ